MNLYNRKRLTELESKLMVARGKGQLGLWQVMYTLLYLKWITNRNLLYSTRNSAQCYVPAWMGLREVWGRMDVGT